MHVGENKGWEVYFQKVPIVQIPNIQHLIGSGQTSVVYTDIALEHNNPLESTEKISDDTDASNSNPVSDCTQCDVHAEVTNTDDVVNGSSKTAVVGGEVRYSVHAQVTNMDDNGDKEMGTDKLSETDDGGKNENDSGTSDSKPDSESSDSESSSSGSSEYQSGSADKSSGESSKSSKLGFEKNNVHDNNTVACDITSEQKDSAEVPTEEKDEESLSQMVMEVSLTLMMKKSLNLVTTCYLRNS